MKHTQTIILAIGISALAFSAGWEARTGADVVKSKIAVTLNERIDMLYRAHFNVEIDLEKQKARITALENRPQVVPSHWHAEGVVHVTNGMIDIQKLGTPVRPTAEEQQIIEETLKEGQ